jgi:hypothetical protein
MGMRRVVAVAMLALVLLCGCRGLGVKPMPDRLGDDEQQAQDYGWQQLVARGATVDRQTLLDVVLLHQLYHVGVDHLYLVSERQVGKVRVVMESQFERQHPEADTFVVRFLDDHEQMLRQDVFTSDELDAAVALYMTAEGESEGETAPERAARQARVREKQARLKAAEEAFPPPPGQPASVPPPFGIVVQDPNESR